MLFFPNCKINIGLIVKGKREDGYHDIETVFYPIPLKDALEIISSPVSHQDLPAPVFSSSGIPIDGVQNDNLCLKAYQVLKKDFLQIPSIKIHLHKAIPIGAGLGGGSADAAFTLIALNEKYTLKLSNDQLIFYALQLGSDCPFFILNKPCIGRGRGEILQPINIELTGYQLVIINPGIHISTRWAFSQIDQAVRNTSTVNTMPSTFLSILSQPVGCWKDVLVNDFEKPVFEKFPEIKSIKETLYASGALFAGMSGSGSTIYGIFNMETTFSFNFPDNYFQHSILL